MVLLQVMARLRLEAVKVAWGRSSPRTTKNADWTRGGEVGALDKLTDRQVQVLKFSGKKGIF